MPSLSGTAQTVGNESAMENVFIDGAPEIWIQDTQQSGRFNPDDDGFYFGLSGTATYPAIKLGCFNDVVFKDNITMNDVICDASGGLEAVIQTRGYVEVTFTLKSMFPLSILTNLLRWGAVTLNAVADAEKVGIGDVTRKNLHWRMFLSRIYDETTGDYVSITVHKGQFIDAWELNMPFGDSWNIALTFRGFVDTSLPAAQKFATVIRVDPSVLG